MGEVLYNGIELPDTWPPRDTDFDDTMPMRVPYLQKRPEVINIDVGRQLFVDDFLLDGRTDMTRTFHTPAKYPGNPVFFPQTHDEFETKYPPCAVAKSGGVWYDPKDKLFKMWYLSSYLGYSSYATSVDGIHWDRPNLDVVPGTNHVLPRNLHPDSGSVVIDHFTDNPNERFKMMVREPHHPETAKPQGRLYSSADGIHWHEHGFTGEMGDRSTMFYNPYRKKWVQSIRSGYAEAGRTRNYQEHDDFVQSGQWSENDPSAKWFRADIMDKGFEQRPECYNLDAIAYESVMIGFVQILKGPPNHIGERVGRPKLTELTVGYSRDGFHWLRPNRDPFIPARRVNGSWEYGYVESSAGMCCIVGDELWFYYSAYAGDETRTSYNMESWHLNGTYANGAVGLAKLRRDGFVSMDSSFADAKTITRPLTFSGSHLFVNANTVGDRLKVEVRDAEDKPIDGFTFDDCIGFLGNSTKTQIKWKNADLSQLAGKPVKFVFTMCRGALYSFWVSKTEDGKSGGYLGAGGPGFTGPIDE